MIAWYRGGSDSQDPVRLQEHRVMDKKELKNRQIDSRITDKLIFMTAWYRGQSHIPYQERLQVHRLLERIEQN